MPDHASTQIRCDNCGSTGFNASAYEPGNCEFCDGSFGGNPTDPVQDAREMMYAMYGSQLYPYQTELLTRIMDGDFSQIEARIETTRAERQQIKADTFMERYSAGPERLTVVNGGRGCGKSDLHHKMQKQLYYEMIGHRADFVIFDEPSAIYRYAWDPDFTPDNRGEKDWKRSMFKQDTASSTPSAAKRAKLRAKRKKRK